MKRAALALVLLPLLAAAAALAWLVATEPGLRWAIARAEAASGGRLTIADARGALNSVVTIGRVSFADGGTRIEARQLQAEGDALALLRGQIGIEPLRIASLQVALTGTAKASSPQPELALPMGVRFAQVSISRFELRTGKQRQLLTDVRFSHAALGPRGLSAAGSFTRPDARFPAQVRLELKGTLELLQVTIAASVAGIPADGQIEVAPFAAPALRSLEARAGPVNLSRLDAALPRTEIRAVLKTRAAKTGYEGTLSLVNAAPGPLDARRLPVAAAHTRFASAGLASARLEQLRIEVPGGGLLEGKGEVDARRARVSLEVRGLDLQALRANLLRTALKGELDLVIADDEQSVRGTLSQEGMRLEANVVRSGEALEVRRLRATAAGGEITGKGRLKLGEPLAAEAQLQFEKFNPAAFGDYPAGTINGRADVDGRIGEAPLVEVRWTLERSTLLGKPLESRGSAQFARERIASTRAEAKFGASRITVRGSFGRAGDRLAWTLAIPRLQEIDPGLAGALQAEGILAGAWSAHELELSARSPTARVDARLAGGMQADGAWRGKLLELTNAGDYPLRMLGATALVFARDRAELGPFTAEHDAGRLQVREARWAAGRLQTSGEFSALPARWLVLAAGAAAQVRTNLLVDGSWALSTTPRLEGTLQLRRRSGDLAIVRDEEPYPLGLGDTTLDARFADGGVELKLDAASRYGKLALEGSVAPSPAATGALAIGPQSPLDLRARLEAAALAALAEATITQARVDGRLWADLQASGTLAAPSLTGTLRGEALSVSMPPYGVYLKNGKLVAELRDERLRVTQFSIQAGTGDFTAEGEMPLRFAEGGARLAWSARNFGVLERPDLRLAVSGEGGATFDGHRLSLTGTVRAERGHLRLDRDRLPKPGEDVVIVGRAPKAAGEPTPLPFDLDIQLDLGQNLRIEGQGYEAKLTGQVRCVAGEDGALRAYGRVRMVNALVFAYGQRLEVDPGELIFDGALDNPALNITAWRRNQAVEAGVQITGNLQSPRLQLVSNPPVPEAERLSWLVLGRAPGEASRADLGLLQAAAGTLLSRGESLPLDRRVARAVGLDELTLRGAGEAEGNVVAFGKRISDRLYVSYEQGLGAVVTNLVKLDYALGRHWSLRAESGTTSGAGLFYRFSWD
ncbi:MAG: translocation/assembly module TamB domain-containing protein [Betaproteobacteria bacterium]|nr:translocation/assembly module TamB domain-containing protein [Betaproteobacteria bacterium]